MEVALDDRKFYATFESIAISEAEKLFRDYYGREPEVVAELHERVIAGPVTKKEIANDYIIAGR